jgi:hypothetical protein
MMIMMSLPRMMNFSKLIIMTPSALVRVILVHYEYHKSTLRYGLMVFIIIMYNFHSVSLDPNRSVEQILCPLVEVTVMTGV